MVRYAAMSSKRPGQIRFEAWVPEDLYRAFQAKNRGSRKAWLVAALREHVWGADEAKKKPDAPSA